MKTRMRGVTVCHEASRPRASQWAVYVQVVIGDETRKAAARFATEAEALAEAEIAIAEVERLRAAHAVPAAAAAPAPGTFAEFAESWIDGKGKIKPATRRSYRDLIRLHVNPTVIEQLPGRPPVTFGALALRPGPGGLTVAVVDKLRVALNKSGMTSGTQRAVMRVVSSCLGHAQFLELLPTNPAAKMQKHIGSPDDEIDEPNPFTPDHAARLLTWVRTHAPTWYVYFLFLLRTGARVGEAAALQWPAVAFDARQITIRLSYSPQAALDKPGTSGDGKPKTHRIRTLDDVSGELLAELRLVYAAQRAAAFADGREPLYVFLTPSGKRARQDHKAARRVFDRACKAIGAPGHTPHDLRDTFATMHLLAEPKRLLWVSKYLGHRHITTTLNRYTKWVRTDESAGYASAFDDVPAAKRRGNRK